MSANEYEIAHQSQEKFQFYGVALVFTILGLSIQTASFEGHWIARVCELISWVLLLTSGLFGLSHLEWNPVIRTQMAKKDELDEKARRLEEGKYQGVKVVHVAEKKQNVPIDERIGEYEAFLGKLDSQISRLDRKADIKYQFFKWGFFLGLLALASGRAINPIIGIIKELCVAS